jgi:hypothetical protein
VIDAVERLQQEPTLAQLERAWQVAKGEWKETVKETADILSDVPSEIPHPDGELRIDPAELQRSTAHERCLQAFIRFKGALQACGVLGAITEKWGPEGSPSSRPR